MEWFFTHVAKEIVNCVTTTTFFFLDHRFNFESLITVVFWIRKTCKCLLGQAFRLFCLCIGCTWVEMLQQLRMNQCTVQVALRTLLGYSSVFSHYSFILTENCLCFGELLQRHFVIPTFQHSLWPSILDKPNWICRLLLK